MRVTQFTYERRLNLGDYNHKMLNAVAVLDETECPHDAAKNLMEVVDSEILGKPAQTTTKAPVVAKTAAKKKEEPVAEKQDPAPTPAPVAEKQEPVAAPVKEEKQESAPVKEEKKSSTTSTIPYDRNNDAHKKAFTDFLFATYGNNAESKKKGGSFSRSYEGKPMLDAKSGTLLEEFKAALATAMA